MVLGILVPLLGGAGHASAEKITCTGGEVRQQTLRSSGEDRVPENAQPDLEIKGDCTISTTGQHFWGTVNVTAGGTLRFVEPATPRQEGQPDLIEFWANAIIIENGGALKAGVGDAAPFGTNGYALQIVLYGADQSGGDPFKKEGVGALCATPTTAEVAECGIPSALANAHGTPAQYTVEDGVTDDFYPYHGLFGDSAKGTGGRIGYFGYKVLALSFGGTLELHGKGGTTGATAADADPTQSGTSWRRLAADLKPGDGTTTEITLDRDVSGDWQPGDRVVVTSTDYLPNHAEEFVIARDGVKGSKITVIGAPKFPHNGTMFPLKSRLDKASDSFKKTNQGSPLMTAAETRAAVALLTRSIRIVSGGDRAGETFNVATAGKTVDGRQVVPINPNYAFGGHTVFAQGFKKLQVQGVEFRQLGQGGRLMHYPIHFHMARKVPTKAPNQTYIKDSSINESMTRWVVLHSTLDVLLQRNVGYKSIGHGFFLEDATETGNKFYANIGIWTRGAVMDDPKAPADQRINPRNVSGIMSYQGADAAAARYQSDIRHPTAFWISNGWNDFVGNMASGVGTCGACYWLIPMENADPMAAHGGGEHGMKMKWSGYSAMQGPGRAGTTPLKQFYKNYCSTAMHGFMGTGDITDCVQVSPGTGIRPPLDWEIAGIPGIAPSPKTTPWYYPKFAGTLRVPTICEAGQDCAKTPLCDNTTGKNCAMTALDTFTTSFNWAHTNFGAVWLRGSWNMVTRLFMSDVQNGGLGLISGGDYTRSSLPLGYWTAVTQSVFVGETQPSNPYAT
ncbi:MAG: hypothetical protein AB7O80_20315, partial [Acetobacteraceae bacterium]